MPITKRTLTTWRKDALQINEQFETFDIRVLTRDVAVTLLNRILRLTQELIDIELMKGK